MGDIGSRQSATLGAGTGGGTLGHGAAVVHSSVGLAVVLELLAKRVVTLERKSAAIVLASLPFRGPTVAAILLSASLSLDVFRITALMVRALRASRMRFFGGGARQGFTMPMVRRLALANLTAVRRAALRRVLGGRETESRRVLGAHCPSLLSAVTLWLLAR